MPNEDVPQALSGTPPIDPGPADRAQAPSTEMPSKADATALRIIRHQFEKLFTPLSAATLLAVVAMFAACVFLWEISWLRPFLAAAGSGVAAFLGPIPGIISPEARTKWLGSIFRSGDM